MYNKLLLLALIPGVLVVVPGMVAGAETAPSADELVAMLRQHDRELRSLAAVYRDIHRADDDRIKGAYHRRFVAIQAPSNFFRDNGHGHAGLDWRQDPLRKTLLILGNKATLLENLNGVIYRPALAVEGAAPVDVQTELLFLVLCWWPYTDWPPPLFFGRPWSMTSLLTDHQYSLRPAFGRIGARRALALEVPGVDTIWLDASHPHQILRREVYNDRTGALGWRCDYADHVRAGDHLWLPRSFTNQHFDSYASSRDSQERLVTNGKFVLSDIRVNRDVTPQDFQLNPPAGTIEIDTHGGFERLKPVRPGQRQHAQALLKWAQGVTAEEQQPTSSLGKNPDFRSIVPLSLLSLLLGFAVGVRLTSSRRRVWKTTENREP